MSWFDLQWERSWYTLLMKPNMVETAVQWFRMSRAIFAGFSGHGNSIYKTIPLLKKENVHLKDNHQEVAGSILTAGK